MDAMMRMRTNDRRQEYMAWLDQKPDCTGECDRCHREPVALWVLPQELDRSDTGYSYCRPCFARTVRAFR